MVRHLASGLILLAASLPAAEPRLTTEWVDEIWVSHLTSRAREMAGDAVMTEAFYRDALRMLPTSTDLVASLASLYKEKKEVAMAAAAAAYGRVIDPASGVFSNFWAEMEPQVRAAPFDYTEAAEPKSAEAAFTRLHQQALALAEDRNFLRAELHLRELLLDYPRHPQVLLDLGGNYTAAGDWGMFTMLYAYFYALHPDSFDVANNYCVGLERVGLPRVALEVLKRQLAAKPESGYLLDNLARFSSMSGRDVEAEEYARERTRVSKFEPAAFAALAKYQIRRKKFAEAAGTIEAGEKLDAGRADFVLLRAELAAWQKKIDEAEELLRKLRKMVPAPEMNALLAREPFRAVPQLVAVGEDAP